MLKKEDILFLRELREKMLTQDKCCQAAPRYWIIMQRKRIYGFSEDYGDTCTLSYGDKEAESIKDAVEIVEACKEELMATYEADGISVYFSDWTGDIHVQFSKGGEHTDEEVFRYLDDLCEWMKNNVSYQTADELRLLYYKDMDTPAHGPIFMTKAACEEHIAKYGYNYSNPRSYAITAVRSPEIERLWDIIEQTDWECEE